MDTSHGHEEIVEDAPDAGTPQADNGVQDDLTDDTTDGEG